jgi:hypothetical protein
MPKRVTEGLLGLLNKGIGKVGWVNWNALESEAT